jgi:hypothetical protein
MLLRFRSNTLLISVPSTTSPPRPTIGSLEAWHDQEGHLLNIGTSNCWIACELLCYIAVTEASVGEPFQ